MATSGDARLHALADELGIAVWTPDPGSAGRWRSIARAARESLRGNLPPRYATDAWDVPFKPRLADALKPGMRILDVGAGARPMVPPGDRPADCFYVGFDVDGDELRKAPEGSYDEIVVGDVADFKPELEHGFDLVLSWLTMEHVKPVPDALRNLGRYGKPGGRFLGYLSGSFSAHAMLNRIIPLPLAKILMARLVDRRPDTVFRAYYDHCWFNSLERTGEEAWSQAEIVPIFTGGLYFQFSRVLRAPFLAYEEWAYTGNHKNLAAYYLIDAVS